MAENKNPHGLKVGQKLYYVPNRNGIGRESEAEITKIGRKWATCGRWETKIDIVTLEADGAGYSSPGRAYLSEENYRTKIRMSSMWDTVSIMIRNQYRRPDHITECDMKTIIGILEREKKDG